MTSAGRHFLAIEGQPRAALLKLLTRARELKALRCEGRPLPSPLAGRVTANLFFEASTRTRSSFEIAAKLLGADALNWTTGTSSVSKGETLLDTVRNIDAMRPAVMVIRHAASGAAALVAQHVRCSVVNAGDGQHEHPSQALLDALTLIERFGSLEGRKVSIVGDVLHSRVARSSTMCLSTLGAQVTVCAPPTLLPVGFEKLGCRLTTEIDEALAGADAVMMLRIQHERMTQALLPSLREYAKRWGLSAARAASLKESAVIMHPGPINRGVELSSDVADGPRSVILDQVENGVAVRMAILEACA